MKESSFLVEHAAGTTCDVIAQITGFGKPGGIKPKVAVIVFLFESYTKPRTPLFVLMEPTFSL